MNETIHTLITRRSVRKYKKAQISDEDLYLILQAGTYAASGHGLQPCTIVVIQDTDTLARLSALNAKIMGTTSDPMYGAPTVFCPGRHGKIPQCLSMAVSSGQPHECRCVPAPRLMLDQPGQRRIRNARRESPPQRMGPAGTPRRRRPLHRRLWRLAGTGCRSAETRFHQIC